MEIKFLEGQRDSTGIKMLTLHAAYTNCIYHTGLSTAGSQNTKSQKTDCRREDWKMVQCLKGLPGKREVVGSNPSAVSMHS